jgi:hypothetical protein
MLTLRRFSVFTLPFFLVACATYPVPKESVNLSVDKRFDDVSTLLASQAIKCWSSRVSPIKAGLEVRLAGEGGRTTRIEVYRVHWSNGMGRAPFVVVALQPMGARTLVRVAEASAVCGYRGCLDFDLSSDISRWLDGDLSCKSITGKLLFDGLI